MSMFPSYAKVLLAGFSETPDYGVLRTEMDGGIAKQRSRRSLPVVTREATVFVESLADKQAFDLWFRDDLNGGTAWFDWADPLDGHQVKQARIIAGRLNWTSPGRVWLAQVQIETIG